MATIVKTGGGGGGGASLNIDYGTTAPADTSKLWIPLASKPKKVSLLSWMDGQIGTVTAESPDITLTSCATIGDEIWFVKPGTSTASRVYLQRYNPKTKSVIAQFSAREPGYAGQRLVYHKGKVYVVGASYTDGSYGYNEEYLSIVDPSTGKYTNTSVRFTNNLYLSANMSIVSDGVYLYVLCGADTDYVTQCWQINPDTMTVVRKYSFPSALLRASNAVYYNGAIYVVYHNTLTVNSTNVYIGKLDVSTWTFTTVYTNETDMKKMYGWCLAIDGSTVFMFGANAAGTNLYSFDAQKETIIPTIISTGLPTSRMYGTAYNGKLYLPNGMLYSLPYYRELAKDDLAIVCEVDSGGVDIVGGDKVDIHINPLSVYVGNNDNHTEQVNAYTHNGSNWVSLSGESMTADMLNALATLGVT